VLRQLALAGHGIALLDDYTVRDELAAGRLVRLLPGWRVTNSSFEVGIHAIFRQSALLPAKTRAFLDFMVGVAAADGPWGVITPRSAAQPGR
jgi:DNA-binding transcriptional LysR family regulator